MYDSENLKELRADLRSARGRLRYYQVLLTPGEHHARRQKLLREMLRVRLEVNQLDLDYSRAPQRVTECLRRVGWFEQALENLSSQVKAKRHPKVKLKMSVAELEAEVARLQAEIRGLDHEMA
jgi:chromosome segregation ATPase